MGCYQTPILSKTEPIRRFSGYRFSWTKMFDNYYITIIQNIYNITFNFWYWFWV